MVRSLPDRSLIDRLVRGRAWIPVLGVLLAGIVFMQVEILKLGTSIGRSVERASQLETQNGALQANVAALADDQRIERAAAGMGMVMPSPTLLTFLTAHPQHQLGRALAGIHVPDPTGFAAQLAAQTATAALTAPAMAAAAPTAAGSTALAAPGPGIAAAAAPTGTGAAAAPVSGAGSASSGASSSGGQAATGAGPPGTTGSGSSAGAAASTGAAGLSPGTTGQAGVPSGG